MATRTIKLPDVGEGVTEAELAEIQVKPGDHVQEDDPVAAVMTDKATVEITSVYSGKVVWVAGEVGDTLAVGAPLLKIETDQPEADSADDDPAPEADTQAPAAAPDLVAAKAPEKPTAAPAARPGPATPPRPEGAAVLAAPAIRARAREGGIDLRQVRGSGPAGRITQADLDAVFDGWSPQAPDMRPTAPDETIRVTGLRRKIAERMSEANSRIPHITVVEEIDVTDLETLRSKLNAERGDRPKLTMLPFLTAALVRLREQHPEMNAHYDDDAGAVHRYGAVHAGIATMTDTGLIVPVLRHAERRDLFDTAAEIGRLAEACRAGKARREELTGSTITITSLGPLGALATTPIINRPEVAILGVNRMATRPHWDGTRFVPRKMMNISASFDHRVIDGWDAALFVNRIKSMLETPAMIFVKG
ncbi:dihydrolipoamide acetyltransferase family protein [Salipiger abyssi]|uniref:dihydrolipoamide acetyltransferase family protein n=1 Tax=Salipiger abyssi TaxID=1250539 RepID=UPI004058C6EA